MCENQLSHTLCRPESLSFCHIHIHTHTQAQITHTCEHTPRQAQAASGIILTHIQHIYTVQSPYTQCSIGIKNIYINTVCVAAKVMCRLKMKIKYKAMCVRKHRKM